MLQSLRVSPRQIPRMRYRCPSCPQTHHGFPALAYNLPDAIFMLSAEERERSAVISSDLCILNDERYFIRCVLAVAVLGYEDEFEYGPWVEINAEDFSRYSVWFNLGVSPGWRSISGRIANALAGNRPTTLEIRCRVILPDDDESRPFVQVSEESHPLFDEQTHGMPITRATELVAHLKGYVLIVD